MCNSVCYWNVVMYRIYIAIFSIFCLLMDWCFGVMAIKQKLNTGWSSIFICLLSLYDSWCLSWPLSCQVSVPGNYHHHSRLADWGDSQSLVEKEPFFVFLTKQLSWRFRAFFMRSVCVVYPTGVRVSMTLHSEPAGPSTRVGGGGGGRGCVWHHAAQGTCAASLRYSRALHSLYPVPHR